VSGWNSHRCLMDCPIIGGGTVELGQFVESCNLFINGSCAVYGQVSENEGLGKFVILSSHSWVRLWDG
jgi:hypothetical protein